MSSIIEVILQPRITFDASYDVRASVIAHAHELAHEHSFIARSIKTNVTSRAV